jgi:hypothetical protein
MKTAIIKKDTITLVPAPPKRKNGLKIYFYRKPFDGQRHFPVATSNIYKENNYILPDDSMRVVRVETKEKDGKWYVRSLVI